MIPSCLWCKSLFATETNKQSEPGAVATGLQASCLVPRESMRELLAKMIDREVDVVCTGASSLRGRIVKVEEGVVQLKDDADNICFVAIDKIVAVWEKRDKDRHPGFVAKS
ncbi:MAG TPA: MM0924 family protein [Pyrinomonadaceae bacterium]|nr:MM0924 family protein [Pyrinomonadaceae bacterium]